MSEHTTPEQRTELPTGRRMSELRKDGALHMSHEVVQVLSLISGFLMLGVMWSYFFEDFKVCMKFTFNMISEARNVDANFLHQGFLNIVRLFGPHLFIFVSCIAVVGVLGVMLQTKWNIKEKKIKFDWNIIKPLQGLKKIVSVQGFVSTMKALLKLSMMLPIGYLALKGFAPQMIKLMHTSIETILVFVGRAMDKIFWKISYVLIAMAVFDYFWGRHRWFKQNKMTKEEVKDEKKSLEGDEATKRKIVLKGLQRIMQRIMNNVPKAHVVITNPTHYAIALRYEREKMAAPVVVAKGKGFVALKIREIARKNSIPVVERKPLARALYASTEVGSEIPNELFRAVAEVLAYIYRLSGKQAVSAGK
jgi:flagellar biosynthetic protein FlhB